MENLAASSQLQKFMDDMSSEEEEEESEDEFVATDFDYINSMFYDDDFSI